MYLCVSIFNVEGSPCLDVPNEAEGNKYYSLGPPYIFHREDGERIAESWTNFVPRVYEGYPYLLAEMYAYSMAAAHEKLPHLRMDQYMVGSCSRPIVIRIILNFVNLHQIVGK